jgi:hypothetical protein
MRISHGEPEVRAQLQKWSPNRHTLKTPVLAYMSSTHQKMAWNPPWSKRASMSPFTSSLTCIVAPFSIVAVHGLKGNAFKTWTVKGATPNKDVLWLRDLLPKDIPTARILTYGYDSDPGKVFESASTNMVHHHATTLVSELHYFRRVCIKTCENQVGVLTHVLNSIRMTSKDPSSLCVTHLAELL